MKTDKIVDKIKDKYQNLGVNPDTFLEGLLQAKPINYWDYIQVDTLLTLQKTRTDFKDEAIFVMYHQVTELVLKMMIHELKQLVEEDLGEDIWMDKLERLTRYTDMLITSFDVMRSGMSYEDYNIFRSTLAPASGFQSAQFRYLELYCTRLENLINRPGKQRLPENPSTEDMFENIYWKDAGYNRKTGEKTLTLRQFEDKYEESFINLAKKLEGNTLEEKAMKMNPSKELLAKFKEFDYQYNVAWPIVHLETAKFFLNSKGENKAATGGSEWQKYLHPKYQQRKFFPGLWSEAEIAAWGEKQNPKLWKLMSTETSEK